MLEVTKQALIREMIHEGVELLDDQDPTWFTKINLATLDLKNPCQCVLGQVFGDYDLGLDVLDLDRADYYNGKYPGAEHGFDSDPDHDFTEAGASYSDLQTVWEEIIKERQAKAQEVSSGS